MAKVLPYEGSKKQPNPDYKEMYVANGKAVDASEAFNLALSGKDVYHCVKQEARASRSGKGVSMKAIRKNK